jgi:glutaredoxin-related protein
LAEGSDLIAAEKFIRWKTDKRKELAAILPMPCADYLQTFTSKENLKFFEKIWQASTTHTELKSNDTNLNDPYIMQSEYLVSSGDVLLAVANLSDPLKKGGTIDTIQKFLKTRKSIFCFDHVKNEWYVSDPIHFYTVNISSSFNAYKHLYEYVQKI